MVFFGRHSEPCTLRAYLLVSDIVDQKEVGLGELWFPNAAIFGVSLAPNELENLVISRIPTHGLASPRLEGTAGTMN